MTSILFWAGVITFWVLGTAGCFRAAMKTDDELSVVDTSSYLSFSERRARKRYLKAWVVIYWIGVIFIPATAFVTMMQFIEHAMGVR